MILPGVGAFADAMAELRRTGLARRSSRPSGRANPAWASASASSSSSTPATRTASTTGLGLLPGRVVRFAPRPGLKIPHMGWNTLLVRRPVPLLEGLGPEPSVYFVHSYHAVPTLPEDVAAEADYPTLPGARLAREPHGLPVPSREEPARGSGDVREFRLPVSSARRPDPERASDCSASRPIPTPSRSWSHSPESAE